MSTGIPTKRQLYLLAGIWIACWVLAGPLLTLLVLDRTFPPSIEAMLVTLRWLVFPLAS